MKIKNVELETVCGVTSKLPDNPLPEVAFAGKSNVGKSSLINAIINRKSLARTSSQPGKTQTINFYNLNKEMYLVDLPGYGYAKVSNEEKAKWGKMIEKYLRTSKVLKQVFLLIDIRHEPSKNDKLMYDWIISNGYEPVIICTKADKISRGAVPKNVKIIKDTLKVKKNAVVIPFSAETKQGRDEIYAIMDNILLDFQSQRGDNT
ncbi:MAG: YihA family ribosome biogenesis GTP-binding protein [Lachnospiraceae bacterium]|nr:YihA family ribosome biogenesis GTP-binding protein [Lachnospiraceae bacterium]